MPAKILDREYRVSSRFCIVTMRTRFGDYEHLVKDAETVSDAEVRDDQPSDVVFQTSSYHAAHQYCDNFETDINR